VVSTGAWSSLASASSTVEERGSLSWAGRDHIYSMRGDMSTDVWRYSISADSWESLASAPANVDDGRAMIYLNGEFYALRGDNNNDFWKFTATP